MAGPTLISGIGLKSNIDAELKRLRQLAVNVPTATAKALTFTAERVQQAEREEIQRVFDRPTPYTLRSLFLKSATPQNLEARVYFKGTNRAPAGYGKEQIGSHYLEPQVYGGGRPLKAFERYLQSAGWLPVGMYAVPGSRAKLDAYGNMNRGELVRILSALRALPQQGYLANRSARSEARRAKSKKPRALVNYFVGRPHGRGPDGVWERVPGSNGLRPILIFVKRPQYRQRFRFHEIARRVTERVFSPLFARALEREALPGRRVVA